MIHLNVKWYWRTGAKGHRRCVLYYTMPNDRMTRRVKKGPRTGADPTAKMMRHWEHEAALMACQWEKDLNFMSTAATIHMPVVTAAQRFLDASKHKRQPGTVERYARNLKQFSNWIMEVRGSCNVSSLRTLDFAKYREYMMCRPEQLSGATVNLSLYDLSAWCDWCLGESYVTQNFARAVNKVSAVTESMPLAIRGAGEFWALMGKLDSDIQVASVGLMACTGMRINELRWLRWDNSWDYHVGALAIGGRMDDTVTKRHRRLQPVPDITRHYLMMLRCMQDGPYVCGIRRGHDRLSSQVNTWLKPLGLSPKHLRRWFRSSLVTVNRLNGSSTDETLINDLLGHQMRRTRAAYERLHDIEGTKPLMDAFSKWLLAARPDLSKATPIVMPDDEALGSVDANRRIYPMNDDEEF